MKTFYSIPKIISIFKNILFFALVLQCFVILVTMIRECLDDYRRYRRDKEANSQLYKKLTRDGLKSLPSSNIKVGDLITVEKVCTCFLFIYLVNVHT